VEGVFTAQVVGLKMEVDVASFGTEDGFTCKGVPHAAYFSQLLGRGRRSKVGAWSVHYGVLKLDLLHLLGR
jgi:hypothetical protein